MKVLLGLVVLAAISTSAFAEQAAVNDPQYQPNAGTIFGDTTFGLVNGQFSGTGYKGTVVTQQVGYALADNISVLATLAHQNIEQMEGMRDIKLDGKYRLLNGENRLDILGGVSISPGKHEIKSNGDENAYTGGHAVRAGAEYGNRTASRTWSVFGLYNYLLKSTEKDKGTGDKTKYDAHSKLDLGAKLYTVLAENCGFLATAGVNFTQKYDDNQSGEISGETFYYLGGEFQHVVNNNLYLKAGFRSDIDGNGSGLQYMTYSVGAGYQF